MEAESEPIDWGRVGRNVHYARAKQRLTRDELAALSGINISSIFRVEKGKAIRRTTLQKIVDAMNVPTDWFLHYQSVSGPTYDVHRSENDRWLALFDSRSRVPADHFEGYQSPQERYRLGSLGFVPIFVRPGAGSLRLEVYGQYQEGINYETHSKGVMCVLAGRITVVIDGDTLQLSEGDEIMYQCNALQSIKCAAQPGATDYPAHVLWNGVEPIRRKRRCQTRGESRPC